MARLYRPHVPLEARCRVVLRQLGEFDVDEVLAAYRGSLGKLLADRLPKFAALLGCDVKDLRLDHDPALALRPQERRGLGRKTYYVPDANDPNHLFYRPHGTQFEGSHDVKTRIRGDHGQYPDRVLIKRRRRREKAEMGVDRIKRGGRFAQKSKVSPPIKSANRWPPRGSRKIANRGRRPWATRS